MIALVRTETVKAVRRARTIVITLGVVALPVLIAVAIHAHRAHDERGGVGLFQLAPRSGLLVPAVVLEAMSGFLLVVVAAMIAGDAVAGDAASGNLRYVLIRPVSRVKLLVSKAIVSTALVWVATALVSVSALVAGVILFGWHPFDVPRLPFATGTFVTGFHVTTTTLLERVGLATAYVAFGLTALIAMATFFSTVTDLPAGAIGAAVGAYIVSEILDGIPALGRIRYGLPTHYFDVWLGMFTRNELSPDLVAGIVVQLCYLAVFGTLALWWFQRRDIRA